MHAIYTSHSFLLPSYDIPHATDICSEMSHCPVDKMLSVKRSEATDVAYSVYHEFELNSSFAHIVDQWIMYPHRRTLVYILQLSILTWARVIFERLQWNQWGSMYFDVVWDWEWEGAAFAPTRYFAAVSFKITPEVHLLGLVEPQFFVSIMLGCCRIKWHNIGACNSVDGIPFFIIFMSNF